MLFLIKYLVSCPPQAGYTRSRPNKLLIVEVPGIDPMTCCLVFRQAENQLQSNFEYDI